MKAIVIASLFVSFIACLFLGLLVLLRAKSKGRFYSFPAMWARDMVFEQMRDAAVVVDDSGSIIDHNRAAEELFGELSEVSGDRTIESIMTGDARRVYESACESAGATLSIPDCTGADRRFETRCTSIRGARGQVLGEIHSFIDVTERELLQEKLSELASTDELTRLPNRRRFYELADVELERARRHARPIGLAVMDMNGFKEINDRYGHQAGDEALRLAARLCVDTLRSCDIVCRIGGDEFAFVFPECDEAGAAAAAEKIRSVVGAATFSSGTSLVSLSASIGSVGSAGPVHPDLEDLLASADRRMYQEKSRLARTSA